MSELCINIFTAIKLVNIQLELAQEEERSLQSGFVAIHETSPAKFLQKGLELEDQQYVLLLYTIPQLTHVLLKAMASQSYVRITYDNSSQGRTPGTTQYSSPTYRPLA